MISEDPEIERALSDPASLCLILSRITGVEFDVVAAS